MFEAHSVAIYELLRNEGLIAADELEALWEEHRATGKSIAGMAVEHRLIDRAVLLERIAVALGCTHASELPAALPLEAVALLESAQARNYGVIPLRADERCIELLALDPFNPQTVNDLSFALGRDVRLVVGDPAHVADLIRQHYGADEAGFADLLGELEGASDFAGNAEGLSTREIESLASQAPIVRFVNAVLGQAIRDRASDLHFEPFEHEFKIRYRVDGALYEMTPPPKTLALSITSRIKVLANLNIAERRLPQDGRIRMAFGERPVDLRVSTLPTQFGESVVLRVLDQSTVQLDITQLGMPADVLANVSEMVRRPNGIFVVTGPTGSGKTTTLYSGLRLINTADLKILTAEDPVEYEIEGVMQVPVSPSVGLTFASALRSFLRQDPDVIMVGEIRDLETAQIAIQAALTGHLVLTTLHTNDAAGAVTRLIDMGVEPFLIASTLEGVLAQRLLRKICPDCRTEFKPSVEALAQLGDDAARLSSGGWWRGNGCANCDGTGYRGRVGVFEWLPIGEPLRELIVAKSPALMIREKGIEQGMRTLREDALRALIDGRTTVDEVMRYT